MFDQRRIRWADIVWMLYKCFVLTWDVSTERFLGKKQSVSGDNKWIYNIQFALSHLFQYVQFHDKLGIKRK